LSAAVRCLGAEAELICYGEIERMSCVQNAIAFEYTLLQLCVDIWVIYAAMRFLISSFPTKLCVVPAEQQNF
jgi:hypothetical protein